MIAIGHPSNGKPAGELINLKVSYFWTGLLHTCNLHLLIPLRLKCNKMWLVDLITLEDFHKSYLTNNQKMFFFSQFLEAASLHLTCSTFACWLHQLRWHYSGGSGGWFVSTAETTAVWHHTLFLIPTFYEYLPIWPPNCRCCEQGSEWCGFLQCLVNILDSFILLCNLLDLFALLNPFWICWISFVDLMADGGGGGTNIKCSFFLTDNR